MFFFAFKYIPTSVCHYIAERAACKPVVGGGGSHFPLRVPHVDRPGNTGGRARNSVDAPRAWLAKLDHARTASAALFRACARCCSAVLRIFRKTAGKAPHWRRGNFENPLFPGKSGAACLAKLPGLVADRRAASTARPLVRVSRSRVRSTASTPRVEGGFSAGPLPSPGGD